jgi:hypothetical protein
MRNWQLLRVEAGEAEGQTGSATKPTHWGLQWEVSPQILKSLAMPFRLVSLRIDSNVFLFFCFFFILCWELPGQLLMMDVKRGKLRSPHPVP